MAKKKAKSKVEPQERPAGKRGPWSAAEKAWQAAQKSNTSAKSTAKEAPKAAASAKRGRPSRPSGRSPMTEDRISGVENRQKTFYAREAELNARKQVVLHCYETAEQRDQEIDKHPGWSILSGEEVRSFSHVKRGEQAPEYIWENPLPPVESASQPSGSAWTGLTQTELTFIANTSADRSTEKLLKALPTKVVEPLKEYMRGLIDEVRTSLLAESKGGKKDVPIAAGTTANLPVASSATPPPQPQAGAQSGSKPAAAPNVDRQPGAH